MVEPSKRTRSVKKKRIRTPGGRNVTHFKRKKASKPVCGLCEKQLCGVASGTATKMKNTAKTKKIPSKPYAGVLCTICLDRLIRYQTRMEASHMSEKLGGLEISRDLQLEKFLPRGWYADVKEGVIKKQAPKREKPKKK